jgi:hypothetical protein
MLQTRHTENIKDSFHVPGLQCAFGAIWRCDSELNLVAQAKHLHDTTNKRRKAWTANERREGQWMGRQKEVRTSAARTDNNFAVCSYKH